MGQNVAMIRGTQQLLDSMRLGLVAMGAPLAKSDVEISNCYQNKTADDLIPTVFIGVKSKAVNFSRMVNCRINSLLGLMMWCKNRERPIIELAVHIHF